MSAEERNTLFSNSLLGTETMGWKVSLQRLADNNSDQGHSS